MTDQDWFTLDDTVADEVLRATTRTNGAEPDRPADSWTPIDLTTLPDQPPVQPTLGGTSLIYPGKRHVFSGPPESAKTLAAYAILIRVARCQQTAILIDFEMGAYDARQRLYELGATKDEVGAIHFLEPAESATQERIENLIYLQPSLVVVDAAAGAYALEGLDDNKRQDVEKVARLYVTLFWRAGIATIFIDHVVKDAEHRGRFAIGSERKLGGADVHFGFETISPISRGTAGRYKILTHKDRAGYMKRGHVADMVLESDPDTHAMTWRFTEPRDTSEDGYFRPTHQMEKVSKHLESCLEPVSRKSVRVTVTGSDKSILQAIDVLVLEQFVIETAGANHSKLLESTRPYREDETSDNPTKSPETQGVPELFSSCSETPGEVGCSGVLGLTKARTPGTPTTTPGNGQWFSELTEQHDDWINSLEPDLDE